MSNTPEIPQNSVPQAPRDEKEPVVPSSDPVFSMDQVKEMMKMQWEAFSAMVESNTPTQKESILTKYQESLKSRVVDSQANLMRPVESQKPRVNPLEYVNTVLDEEKQHRDNVENGRMATQHKDPIQLLKDKIYIMSEFQGNTREEIANVLKDEIAKLV